MWCGEVPMTLRMLLLLVLVLCPLLKSAAADETEPQSLIETPSAAEVEEKFPTGTSLDGNEIYDRFVKNRRRLRSVYQEGRILSRDPSGNPQQTTFWLRVKDYRDENDDPVDDVLTKVLLKVSGPRDLRHTGYLYVEHDDMPDDQFMYSPVRSRTFRVALKGQSVAGTDFSFDDFLVKLDDIEDAEYRRLDDETVDGVECYVVEAVMKPSAKSSYSRSRSYLEKLHYVPIKVRYWDEVGVEVKVLTSPYSSIKNFDGAWLPTKVEVVDLLEETRSELIVDKLEPNPDVLDSDFSLSVLEYRP